MLCPWCEREMQAGEIIGDARSSVRFQPESKKLTFGDSLCGIGKLTAIKSKWATFYLPAHYCSHCRKMVVETDVAK